VGTAHWDDNRTWLDRAATTATGLGLGRDDGRLSGEGLVDHGLGDRLTELDGQFLQVRQLGPPGHAVGPIDPIKEIYCDALQELLRFRPDDRRLGWVSHP
jgi:hypothetical protein